MIEMTDNPSAPAAASSDPSDIAAATERLFDDIAESSGDDGLRSSMRDLNAQMRAIRPFEGEFFFDRDQELAELSLCWTRRDLPQLRRLLAAYFARRRALVPQLVQRLNASSG